MDAHFSVEVAFWLTDERGTADVESVRDVVFNHLFDALAALKPAGYRFGWRGMDVTDVSPKQEG